MWQDYAITAVQFAFVAALVPSVLGPRKPEPLSCALTASLLYFMAYVLGTLGLWVSVASTALVATTWAVLLFQQWRP